MEVAKGDTFAQIKTVSEVRTLGLTFQLTKVEKKKKLATKLREAVAA